MDHQQYQGPRDTVQVVKHAATPQPRPTLPTYMRATQSCEQPYFFKVTMQGAIEALGTV